MPAEAPDFVQRVTAVMLAGKGDALPVSAFPPDGTWPTATSRWEKRGIAAEIPIWEPDICIQCNQCALVCPHAAIRAKVYEPAALDGAPEGFRSRDYKAKDLAGLAYSIQVAPDDCTGCRLCVEVCPAKDKANPRHKAINMEPYADHRETRAAQATASSSTCRSSTGAHLADGRQGLAVPRAAVRVLGRLRRLRRDALRQAADPALRRPAC